MSVRVSKFIQMLYSCSADTHGIHTTVKELLRKQGFSVQDDAALRQLASANTSTARRALAAIQGTTSSDSVKAGGATASDNNNNNAGSASAQRRASNRADARGRLIIDVDGQGTDVSVSSMLHMYATCIRVCVYI